MRDGDGALPAAGGWFQLGEIDAPRAVALLVHGLNTNPARMDGLGALLGVRGVACFNAELSGHRPPPGVAQSPAGLAAAQLDAFRSVDREHWLGEVQTAYAQARERADRLGVPLLFVGYSLGATLGADLEAQPGAAVRFAGRILFAPAFYIPWYTRALRLLSPFPRLALHSFSPAHYSANRATPIAAYMALFDSIAELRRRGGPPAGPTLVFIDPQDELVRLAGLREIERSRADWEVVVLEKSLRPGRDYHHLIIDEPSLGPELWSDVTRRIEGFLSNLEPPRPTG